MTEPSIASTPINYILLGKPLTNQAFVEDLYTDILDRSADASGLQFWTSRLHNLQATREQVITEFFNSVEAQYAINSSSDLVTCLYHSILMREPDVAGFNFWLDQYATGKFDIGSLIEAFFSSLEYTNLQSRNSVLPTLDVVWQDFPSWDGITAGQLSRLISYTPDDGATYPNANLNFIVSGVGPNNSDIKLTPKSHYNPDGTLPDTIYKNDASGLAGFLKSISDEVSSLTQGKVKWNLPGGTGSVGYHPDMSQEDFGDWAQWSDPKGSFSLTSQVSLSYQAYIDYSLYLSAALKQSGLKGFAQVIFESEASGFTANQLFNKTDGEQGDGVLYEYKGNPYLLKINGNLASWQDAFVASSTTGPTGNWNSAELSGFGSSSNYAQIYDLYNGGYVPAWPWDESYQMSPNTTPTEKAVTTFANFFAQQPSITPAVANPLNNIIEMVSGSTNTTTVGNKYNPNAAFIFSYGITQTDGPVFQNSPYSGVTDSFADPVNGYAWGAADFASFSEGFKATLTNYLQNLQGPNNFTNTNDLIIGVWGGERALDAWFGISPAT